MDVRGIVNDVLMTGKMDSRLLLAEIKTIFQFVVNITISNYYKNSDFQLAHYRN